jgi:hypothetical protein
VDICCAICHHLFVEIRVIPEVSWGTALYGFDFMSSVVLFENWKISKLSGASNAFSIPGRCELSAVLPHSWLFVICSGAFFPFFSQRYFIIYWKFLYVWVSCYTGNINSSLLCHYANMLCFFTTWISSEQVYLASIFP